MPFRHDFETVLDAQRRLWLQDVFEFVWLALVDHGVTSIPRAEVAQMILTADESGMAPESIKDRLVRDLTRTGLLRMRKSVQMSSKAQNTKPLLQNVSEHKIDEILNSVWEMAVHKNPMCLVKMIDPNSTFKQLRTMIRDCITKGLSEGETREHALQELLQASASSRSPKHRCDDPPSPDSFPGQLIR
jgi:hypothetical protein